MMPWDAARILGKAIDEKARKVLDCEYQVRPAIEMIPARWLAWYGLERWLCRHCRRPYRYSVILKQWKCRCGRAA